MKNRNTYRSQSVPLSQNKYDSFSESDEYDYYSSSPDVSPIMGPGMVKLNSSDNCDNCDSNTTNSLEQIGMGLSYKRKYILMCITLVLIMGLVYIMYPSVTVVVKPTDYWAQYTKHCCVYMNHSGIYSKVSNDCNVSDLCFDYLNSWLNQHNQTFWNSSWTDQCCYVFGGISSLKTKQNIYCSYNCLNSQN